MAFREVAVTEIREVLRAWLAGAGLRKVAEQAGVDRKTARRYVEPAVAAGLDREGGPGRLSDELVGQVAQVVRPARPGGHGLGWERLEARHGEIEAHVKAGLSVVKIGVLLERQGVVVAYRTLHRFCVERCGFGKTASTVRVADGAPRRVPARLRLSGPAGRPGDRAAAQGPRADLHGVLLAAHVRVAELHPDPGRVHRRVRGGRGCSSAACSRSWFPDNASAIAADADAVNPRFTAGWLRRRRLGRQLGRLAGLARLPAHRPLGHRHRRHRPTPAPRSPTRSPPRSTRPRRAPPSRSWTRSPPPRPTSTPGYRSPSTPPPPQPRPET
jgi:hypothetical protein